MLKNQTINLKVVEKVANGLGDLNNEVLYIGGAVVGLYVTDVGAEQPRPTKDVDITVQVSSYSEMEKLREDLATKGIYPASGETIMYRYTFDGILIDFIPFEDTPLGPTNIWLKPGFDKSRTITIGDQLIRILPVNYYLATKWEAFKDRGSDPRMSHDFEDIIYVVDNNKELVKEVAKSEEKLLNGLKEITSFILNHKSSKEIVECHINPFTVEIRSEIVFSKLKEIDKM